MRIEIRPMDAPLGAEVFGLGCAEGLDEQALASIEQAWLAHSLLVFRDVSWTPQQHVAFTRRLGPLHIMTPLHLNLPGLPEVFVVSNRMHEGKPVGLRRAGWGWHSDGEDKLIPNAGSLLYAVTCTPGEGDTLFASMYRALDALPADLRTAIDGRRGRFSRIDLHLINYPNLEPLTEQEKRDRPDVYHPLIREHPRSGREALFVGRWAADIEGVPADEGADIVRRAREFAVRDEFVYRHTWQPGDAVLWDNRCMLHSAVPFDDDRHERHMLRTTLEGDLPRGQGLVSSLAPARL